MGVNHLRRDAAMVHGAQGNTGGSPGQRQVAQKTFARPAENSGTTSVPEVGEANSFSRKGLKPGNSARPEPFGGPRAGSKSGQEKVGTPKGNTYPTSGGRLGAS